MENVLPELISQEIIYGGTFFTGTYFGSHLHCGYLEFETGGSMGYAYHNKIH